MFKLGNVAWFLGRLRVQFTLYIAALLVIFTALVLAFNWRGQEEIVLDRLDANVSYVAAMTAILAGDRLQEGDVAGLTVIVGEIVELEDAMSIAILSPDGQILVEGRGLATAEDFRASPDAPLGVQADRINAAADVIVGGAIVAQICISRALQMPGAAAGGSILGNAAFGEEAASFHAVLERNLLIGLIMFVLAIPLAAFFINRTTRGISSVTKAANQMAAGDLDVEIPQSGTGEVAELQNSFRVMQTELRDNIGKIEALAYTDGITGLANRARFQQALEGTFRGDHVAAGAVLMIDLDHFKGVNDAHGHRFGDRVLAAVGTRLASLIATEGAEIGIHNRILARFGGDGFALLVRGAVDRQALERLSDGIIRGLEEPFQIAGMRINIGCSIGIAPIDKGARSPTQLLQQVDLAMYSAKNDGRRRARFFSAEIRAAAKRNASLESDLRDAIRTDALLVYYQPKIRCDTLAIAGAEALLRWRHPTEGFISPSEFIPIAEGSGLIADTGNRVLAQSLNEFRRLYDEGIDLSLAVNVAALQLQRADFVASVVGALTGSRFPPDRLELELTESTAILASERPDQLMAPLRELGVRFAIDDFGTGHSSLGRLPSPPFDILKIDQSFIADLADSADKQTIVRTVTSLAHGLGLEIVAEGVEREEDYLILRECRVHLAQGFLWSPALPFAEFATLVRAMRPAETEPAGASSGTLGA